MNHDNIVVGSKVKLQKDCYYCDFSGNPEAGAVGEVYKISSNRAIWVHWFSGTYNEKELEKEDNLKNCYAEHHLKLIP